jgi:hypothetical protein
MEPVSRNKAEQYSHTKMGEQPSGIIDFEHERRAVLQPFPQEF